jgi:hypothetical protein
VYGSLVLRCAPEADGALPSCPTHSRLSRTRIAASEYLNLVIIVRSD